MCVDARVPVPVGSDECGSSFPAFSSRAHIPGNVLQRPEQRL